METGLGQGCRGWTKARTNYVLQSTGATGGTRQVRALAGKAQARAEKTPTVMILLDNVPRFSKALKIVIRFDNISQSEVHWVCPLTPISISPSLIKRTQIDKETLSL